MAWQFSPSWVVYGAHPRSLPWATSQRGSSYGSGYSISFDSVCWEEEGEQQIDPMAAEKRGWEPRPGSLRLGKNLCLEAQCSVGLWDCLFCPSIQGMIDWSPLSPWLESITFFFSLKFSSVALQTQPGKDRMIERAYYLFLPCIVYKALSLD